MKKIIFACAVIISSVNSFSFAQTNTQPVPPQNNKIQQNNKNSSTDYNKNSSYPNSQDQNRAINKNSYDGYVMQNGMVVVRKEGVISNIDKDITFENGTRITRNGAVITATDGSIITLKENEYIDMSGNIISTRPKAKTLD